MTDLPSHVIRDILSIACDIGIEEGQSCSNIALCCKEGLESWKSKEVLRGLLSRSLPPFLKDEESIDSIAMNCNLEQTNFFRELFLRKSTPLAPLCYLVHQSANRFSTVCIKFRIEFEDRNRQANKLDSFNRSLQKKGLLSALIECFSKHPLAEKSIDAYIEVSIVDASMPCTDVVTSWSYCCGKK